MPKGHRGFVLSRALDPFTGLPQVMAPNCFFVALQTSSDGLLHVMHVASAGICSKIARRRRETLKTLQEAEDPEATDFLFQSSSEARCSEDPFLG